VCNSYGTSFGTSYRISYGTSYGTSFGISVLDKFSPFVMDGLQVFDNHSG
jgi:hypothetical protein